MSETTTNTSGACELVLDYVYGELGDEQKKVFEEHLPTCARCQQEVKSFGRVRAAVKTVMPSVEASASLGGGALHAQLMHAAAQRKPRRGVLLAFPRKMMEHPALSAAAMFVLVGGAFALNWSRGKLAMPVADKSAETAPAAAPVATTVPAEAKPDPGFAANEEGKTIDAPKPAESAAKAAKVAVPSSKAKEQAGYFGNKGGDALDKTQIALETPSGRLSVQRPVAHRAATTPGAGSTATGAPMAAAPRPASPKKEAPPRMKSIAVDGKLAKQEEAESFDDQLAAPAKDLDRKHAAAAKADSGRQDGNGLGGVSGGVLGGGGGRNAPADNVKSSAPQELGRTVAEKAPQRDEVAAKNTTRGYAQPSAPPSPPPTMAMPMPMPTTSSTQSGPQVMQKPAANARDYGILRKQADEYAKSNRCDEAIKLYTELEKSNQYLSPNERVGWVRCLTQRGREDEAQRRLDDLKVEKKVTNAQIQDAEKQLNERRRQYPEAKKKASKKAPAAADRAQDVSTESVQQRANEPAPTQAAPPDSTNTKVQKPAY